MAPLSATLLLRSELPRADVELVILRTAWNCRADYEWVQHVPQATRAGLGRAAIAHLPAGANWNGWSERQRLLLRAADELCGWQTVSDDTRSALRTELAQRELIELCFLVGSYAMLGMTLTTLGIEPEPTALSRLDDDAAEQATELRRLRTERG